MKVFKNIKDIKKEVSSVKQMDKKISFVPTMGSLHKGHLSLIEKAKKKGDILIVSIFLNEKQFTNKEDLEKYPSDIDKDTKILEKENVDILFLPEKKEIYPSDFSCELIENDLMKKATENKKDEEHFTGVLTVVLKLFNIIKPDFAFFGEKDYTQFLLIERMVKNLNLDIKIISVKTVRKKSGLVYSSRNKRLNLKEFELSKNIYQSLLIAKEKKSIKEAEKFLEDNGIKKINYLKLLDRKTLAKSSFQNKGNLIILISVKIGKVKLIDNLFC